VRTIVRKSKSDRSRFYPGSFPATRVCAWEGDPDSVLVLFPYVRLLRRRAVGGRRCSCSRRGTNEPPLAVREGVTACGPPFQRHGTQWGLDISSTATLRVPYPSPPAAFTSRCSSSLFVLARLWAVCGGQPGRRRRRGDSYPPPHGNCDREARTDSPVEVRSHSSDAPTDVHDPTASARVRGAGGSGGPPPPRAVAPAKDEELVRERRCGRRHCRPPLRCGSWGGLPLARTAGSTWTREGGRNPLRSATRLSRTVDRSGSVEVLMKKVHGAMTNGHLTSPNLVHGFPGPVGQGTIQLVHDGHRLIFSF